jgi:uncharacterized hydrophobic protein (TIGR00271 family)
MLRILVKVRSFFANTFTLSEDKDDESAIIASIKRGVSFRGTNVWTLIFAIFIASIGLNVNSTAVVIGAMLISPLMGPIMGIGLGIGINDLELLKKGAKNLLIAASVSIATSFLYFSITPLHEASSELLARTTPTVWDVFIAFVGGLAGIVAVTRKEKSNVIPGVAIATALMPPLCTAGFGLATGQWLYFLGALYLFFINSLFICLAAFLIVKRLRFSQVEFAAPERQKRVSRYIMIIVTLTILPSIYLGYRIVKKTIFETNAKAFVTGEFHFARTQVVIQKYIYKDKDPFIELLLVGQPLTEVILDSLENKLPSYGLKNTQLVVHQGLDAKQKIDLSAIKASVLEEVYANERAKDTVAAMSNGMDKVIPDLRNELRTLFPTITEYSLAQTIFTRTDSAYADTVTLFTGTAKGPFPLKEQRKVAAWIKERIHADSVKVLMR